MVFEVSGAGSLVSTFIESKRPGSKLDDANSQPMNPNVTNWSAPCRPDNTRKATIGQL